MTPATATTTATPRTSLDSSSPFTNLPAEIRVEIYKLVVQTTLADLIGWQCTNSWCRLQIYERRSVREMLPAVQAECKTWRDELDKNYLWLEFTSYKIPQEFRQTLGVLDEMKALVEKCSRESGAG